MASVYSVRSLFFKVVSLPTLGFLSRKGTKLVIGDRFSPLEVYTGAISYTHVEPIADGLNVGSDSFKFSLWKTGYGTVTAEDYSACFPTLDNPTPDDGIFEFNIRIHRSTPPNVRLGSNSFSFIVDSTFPLTTDMFTAGDGINDETTVFTASGLKSGFLTVQNQRNNMFTQADLEAGKVLYTNTKFGDGTEHMDFTVCNFRSQCDSFALDWTINDKFQQTGDNVIYAKTDSQFFWEFTSNAQDTIWELVGGSPLAPPNASTPSTRILEWSTYAVTSSYPENSPERGAGYDKLVGYRNLRETELWGGGLPYAMNVSSYGWLGTGYRLPTSETGTQPWKTPKTPGSYFFTLQAVNPRNGDTTYRRYNLIVNYSGTSPAGLASESTNL